MDCNQSIDSKTGLICATCRVPFCVSNCLNFHAGHKLQNIPQSQSGGGDDIISKVNDAEKSFQELKFNSNSLVDFIRNFDNEISNHQLKIFSLKERISKNPNIRREQVEAFNDKHNTVLKNLTQMYSQLSGQVKEMYKFWGNIAAYNYDDLLYVSTY